MLINLHVKNLALIDEADVFFDEGLNILTGETGAGKSILLGSINLALGAKASRDILGKHGDYASVELLFQVDASTVSALAAKDIFVTDNQVLISRKFTENRNIMKINGENVTLATVRDITSLLIDIHGQHEHQSLIYYSKAFKQYRKQWVEEHIVVIFIVFFAILIIPIAVGRVKRIKYEIDTSEAFRFDNAQKLNKKKKQEG